MLSWGADSIATSFALPGSVACFGATGVFNVSFEQQQTVKVLSGFWGATGSSVYDPDQDALFAFAKCGIYKVNMGKGSYDTFAKGIWQFKGHHGQLACYLGDSTALYIGQTGVYKVDLKTANHMKLQSGVWHEAQTLAYNPETNRAFVFCNCGVYNVNPTTGEHQVVARGPWGVNAAVYICGDTLVCFGTTGIFHLSIIDGTHTKVCTGAWGGTHAALYDKEMGAVFAFCRYGVFKVNPQNGAHEKVLTGRWENVHAAVYSSVGFTDKCELDANVGEIVGNDIDAGETDEAGETKD